MGSRSLRLVESATKPKDITLAMREEIKGPEHWAEVHVRGDRSKATIPHRIRWRPFA
jgi:hypothetical protein